MIDRLTEEQDMAKQGTVARVAVFPDCDICKHVDKLPDDEVKKAAYDFKTYSGPWAYGCEKHYRTFRLYTELGTGMGQRLELTLDGQTPGND